MSKFIVNKSAGNLGLFGGQITIAQGGYVEVSDEQAEHEDVIQCKGRGWLVVVGVQPDGSPAGEGPAPLEFENDKLKGSLTPPGKQAPLEPTPVEEVVAEVAEKVEAAEAEAKPATKAKK